MPIDTGAMMAFVRGYLARHEPAATDGPEGWRKSGAMRWDHTLRVLAVAQRIARVENADVALVTVAAIFHDVRKLDSVQQEHARAGAELAREYLARAEFPEEWIDRVCRIIVNHPAFVPASDNFSLEERVLRDADLLDGIGALGILWSAMYVGLQSRVGKVRKRIAERERASAEWVAAHAHTLAGRAIAEQRLTFLNAFIAQMDDELGEPEALP